MGDGNLRTQSSRTIQGLFTGLELPQSLPQSAPAVDVLDTYCLANPTDPFCSLKPATPTVNMAGIGPDTLSVMVVIWLLHQALRPDRPGGARNTFAGKTLRKLMTTQNGFDHLFKLATMGTHQSKLDLSCFLFQILEAHATSDTVDAVNTPRFSNELIINNALSLITQLGLLQNEFGEKIRAHVRTLAGEDTAIGERLRSEVMKSIALSGGIPALEELRALTEIVELGGKQAESAIATIAFVAIDRISTEGEKSETGNAALKILEGLGVFETETGSDAREVIMHNLRILDGSSSPVVDRLQLSLQNIATATNSTDVCKGMTTFLLNIAEGLVPGNTQYAADQLVQMGIAEADIRAVLIGRYRGVGKRVVKEIDGGRWIALRVSAGMPDSDNALVSIVMAIADDDSRAGSEVRRMLADDNTNIGIDFRTRLEKFLLTDVGGFAERILTELIDVAWKTPGLVVKAHVLNMVEAIALAEPTAQSSPLLSRLPSQKLGAVAEMLRVTPEPVLVRNFLDSLSLTQIPEIDEVGALGQLRSSVDSLLGGAASAADYKYPVIFIGEGGKPKVFLYDAARLQKVNSVLETVERVRSGALKLAEKP